MKNPYEILGLSDSATIEELTARYTELKAEYSEKRFLPGAEGAEAAKKLTELERAWQEIQSKIEVAKASDIGDDYGYVDSLIKEKRYDDAQAALDGIMNRNAEWHYYQALIYYRREWLTECKKQLETAIALDPTNEKYKSVMDRLNQVMGNPNVNPQSMGRDTMGNDPNIQYQQAQTPPRSQGDTLSNCCLAYCFASSCCDCMRCCGGC